MSFCLYALIASVFGAIAATMAADKNRSVAAWCVCGALFGLIGVLALRSLEPLPKLEPPS